MPSHLFHSILRPPARFHIRKTIGVAISLASILITPCSFGQGDGPRAYFPAPVDTNIVAGYGISLEGNQSLASGAVFRGGDLDLNVGVLQYSRSFELFGALAGGMAIVPFGNVSGQIVGGPLPLQADSSGLGDIELGTVVTLFGMPPLVLEEYVAFDPSLVVSLVARASLPTGTYDPNKAVNLGANRWSFQFGLPVTYYRGSSLLDERLTTFEVLPSVTFFTGNNDAFGGGRLEQDPIFTVEAHITQNVNKALWVSIDSLYTYGGETKTNGVSGGNNQSAFSLGGSIGVNLSSSLQLKASYGEVIARNDDGPDGRMLRFVASWLF